MSMTTIERAMESFLAAIEEARELTAQNRMAEVADLMRHARELLDIVHEELDALAESATAEAKMVARVMRERLAALEAALVVKQ